MMFRKRASVLIITLLILFFLSAAVLSLAYYMRLEANLLKRHISRLKSFYIAQGALSSILEKINKDKLNNQFDYLDEGWLSEFQKEGKPFSLEFSDIDGAGAGTYSTIINDEAAKINLNKATPQILEALLDNFKGINAEGLSAEILAYKRDKQTNSNNFYSVCELLRVKGMKAETFWGEDTNENGILDDCENDGDKTLPPDDQDGEIDWGLKDLLTIFTDGKININTASLPVLLSMPGMNRQIARELIEARRRKPFENLEELKGLGPVSGEVFSKISGWATVQSNQFKISIIAESEDTKISRQILAIIDRSTEAPRILYWRQD